MAATVLSLCHWGVQRYRGLGGKASVSVTPHGGARPKVNLVIIDLFFIYAYLIT